MLGLVGAAHSSQTNTFCWSLLHSLKAGILPELRRQTSNDLLKAVFRETGRLYTGLLIIRRVMAPQMLLGKYIPAGTYVACSPLMTSLDPNVFPEPEKFRPQRWLTESGHYDDVKIVKMQTKGESSQFGKGQHKCLGQKLAKLLIVNTWWPMILGDKTNPGYDMEIISGIKEGVGMDNVGVRAAWATHNTGTPFQLGEAVKVKFSRRKVD